ncbi:hypothetical protein INR49_015609 [Caranx melampygus]|nr:hypothetical protein INR49_015609 [Caranx melampygus]
MFTSLWPLPTLYFIWLVMDWQTPERGSRRTSALRKWKVWEHHRDYFPIKLVKTAELNPNKNYILGCHPHGIMSAGAFACFTTESCGFAKMFPGVKSTLAILAGLFRIPFFREYIMAAGLCPVSKQSLVHLLSKSGKGNAVVIVIGGAAESLASSPGVNTVVVRNRKGFVRTALEFGADLVPVYSFGENELFKQVIFTEGSLSRRLQDLFKRIMGFAHVYLLVSAGQSCPTGVQFPLLWEVPLQFQCELHLPRRRSTTITHFTWKPCPSYSMNTKSAVDCLKATSFGSSKVSLIHPTPRAQELLLLSAHLLYQRSPQRWQRLPPPVAEFAVITTAP